MGCRPSSVLSHRSLPFTAHRAGESSPRGACCIPGQLVLHLGAGKPPGASHQEKYAVGLPLWWDARCGVAQKRGRLLGGRPGAEPPPWGTGSGSALNVGARPPRHPLPLSPGEEDAAARGSRKGNVFNQLPPHDAPRGNGNPRFRVRLGSPLPAAAGAGRFLPSSLHFAFLFFFFFFSFGFPWG